MERSAIWESHHKTMGAPDYASLHPGYEPLRPKFVAHPGLDLGHAADPAVVVLGLFAHVAEHLRVRQDQERLLLEAGEHIFGDLLRREVAVAGLRALGNRTQHVGVDALRTEDRDA